MRDRGPGRPSTSLVLWRRRRERASRKAARSTASIAEEAPPPCSVVPSPPPPVSSSVDSAMRARLDAVALRGPPAPPGWGRVPHDAASSALSTLLASDAHPADDVSSSATVATAAAMPDSLDRPPLLTRRMLRIETIRSSPPVWSVSMTTSTENEFATSVSSASAAATMSAPLPPDVMRAGTSGASGTAPLSPSFIRTATLALSVADHWTLRPDAADVALVVATTGGEAT